MASKSLRKKIARRIITAERIIENSRDERAVKKAEQEIIHLTEKYNLSLEDIFEIDEMIQKKY